MNYAVHASMYFYYFLVATKSKPKWFNPMNITALQISQMIVGVAVTLASFYEFQKDGKIAGPCYIPSQNITAGFVMYGSYLFLFLQFFVRRYWIRCHTIAPNTTATTTTLSTATTATTNGILKNTKSSSTSKDKEL
jgi:GNS1/SUR4 family